MANILVTVIEAKRHLRLPEEIDSPLSAHDEDLQTKLDAATELILGYLARRATDTAWSAELASWDVATAPQVVRAAILRQTAELYRFRGDDPEGDAPVTDGGYLAPGVATLLHRLRDPALA
jgi:hypothetical protein